MADSKSTTHFRFWLWLIRIVGVIVPQRLRADWRQEWEAELRCREEQTTGSRVGGAYDPEDWRMKCFEARVMVCEGR